MVASNATITESAKLIVDELGKPKAIVLLLKLSAVKGNTSFVATVNQILLKVRSYK